MYTRSSRLCVRSENVRSHIFTCMYVVRIYFFLLQPVVQDVASLYITFYARCRKPLDKGGRKSWYSMRDTYIKQWNIIVSFYLGILFKECPLHKGEVECSCCESDITVDSPKEEPLVLLISVDLVLLEFVLFLELSHVWKELCDPES